MANARSLQSLVIVWQILGLTEHFTRVSKMTQWIQIFGLLMVVALFCCATAEEEEGATQEQQQADKEQWAKLFQILENQQKAQQTTQRPQQQPNKQQKPPQKFPQSKPQPQRPQQEWQWLQQQQNQWAQKKQQWLQFLNQWSRAQLLSYLQQYWQSQARPSPPKPAAQRQAQVPSKASEQDLLLGLLNLENA